MYARVTAEETYNWGKCSRYSLYGLNKNGEGVFVDSFSNAWDASEEELKASIEKNLNVDGSDIKYTKVPNILRCRVEKIEFLTPEWVADVTKKEKVLSQIISSSQKKEYRDSKLLHCLGNVINQIYNGYYDELITSDDKTSFCFVFKNYFDPDFYKYLGEKSDDTLERMFFYQLAGVYDMYGDWRWGNINPFKYVSFDFDKDSGIFRVTLMK